jgi:ABC-type polar amino acid transport system ATPase subunit
MFFAFPLQTKAHWRERLNCWGYDPLFLTVDQQSGLAAFEEMLEGQTTVVVGPSGVGKSSLINALRCNQDISEEDPIHKLLEQVIYHYISFFLFRYKMAPFHHIYLLFMRYTISYYLNT